MARAIAKTEEPEATEPVALNEKRADIDLRLNPLEPHEYDPRPYMMTLERKDKNGRVTQTKYLEVGYRLNWLRAADPGASVESECVKLLLPNVTDTATGERSEMGMAVFKATVRLSNGAVCTGWASCTTGQFRDGFIEKADTKAKGRALAAAGFGTPDLDEEDLTDLSGAADSPKASPRATNADRPQPSPKAAPTAPKELGRYSGKAWDVIVARLNLTADVQSQRVLWEQNMDEACGLSPVQRAERFKEYAGMTCDTVERDASQSWRWITMMDYAQTVATLEGLKTMADRTKTYSDDVHEAYTMAAMRLEMGT